MDTQRQESKSMNHFKSRTKPRDTRPNLNHWCESMSRIENRVPLTITNTTTGHATRPPTESPVQTNDENTEPRAARRRQIQATNRQKKMYQNPARRTRRACACVADRQRATSAAACQFRSRTRYGRRHACRTGKGTCHDDPWWRLHHSDH